MTHLGPFGFKGHVSSGTSGESLLKMLSQPPPQSLPPSLSRPALRAALRQRRRALTRAQQSQAARGLYTQLAQHPVFRRAQRIGFYLAGDGEIDPQRLLNEAVRRGKTVFLPVLAPWPAHKMAFQPLLANTRWERNRFGIQQPAWQPALQAPPWTLDVLCMPLVGFDLSGGRLGMGGGYYDRYLSACTQQPRRSPTLLGLAHECQQVEQLPLAPWDIPLHAVVTEQRIYRCTDSACL